MKNFSNLGIFFKSPFFTYLPVFESRKKSVTLNLFTFPGSKKSELFSPKLALTDPYHPKSVALPLPNSWVFPQSSSGWILCPWDTVSVAICLQYPCCWFYPQIVLEINIHKVAGSITVGHCNCNVVKVTFWWKSLCFAFLLWSISDQWTLFKKEKRLQYEVREVAVNSFLL